MNPGIMPNQGSPMLGPMEGSNFMPGMPMDMNASQMAMLQGQAGMQQGGAGHDGTTTLQNYRIQLYLLEQQNKKRLLIARRDQAHLNQNDGAPPIAGQGGMQSLGMSPGSRADASPNPDQMKRGPPQLGANGIPASPPAGENGSQGRGSPNANLMGGMTPEFNNPLFMKGMNDNMAGSRDGGMKPPTTVGPGMNMEAVARSQQASRMAGVNWQGNGQAQGMAQQPGQNQPTAMGASQPRPGDMPPPSAPTTGNGANRSNQPPPPSPPPGQAPPTPSQTNKGNPKGKKENGPKKVRAHFPMSLLSAFAKSATC